MEEHKKEYGNGTLDIMATINILSNIYFYIDIIPK